MFFVLLTSTTLHSVTSQKESTFHILDLFNGHWNCKEHMTFNERCLIMNKKGCGRKQSHLIYGITPALSGGTKKTHEKMLDR
jgi:hypothetical protein